MRKMIMGANLAEVGKFSLETLFGIQGNVKAPMLVFEDDGVIIVRCLELEGESDVEKLHGRLLYTISDLIRQRDLSKLFVGYEGFYLMDEVSDEGGAVRVLVGTLYSDDGERVWLAQTHGEAIGEWQDISDNPNRFGFEGLWQQSKAYLRN
jgi:hypothetical protein